MEKLEWSALEYEEKERSNDWFWALGVIVLTSSLASIIWGNYFFAILLTLSGILLAFYARKKPDTVSYELNEKGLQIRTLLYPYETIKSFWVQVELPDKTEGIKPLLFVRTDRIFMPIISIPIDYDMAEEIQSIMMSHNIPEIEMKEHPSERIMESLGF